MLKLSKFGAYTAQKLAQLGEKNSTSALAVLVAFCISGCATVLKFRGIKKNTVMLALRVVDGSAHS
mgnify:CR=1 FL=1